MVNVVEVIPSTGSSKTRWMKNGSKVLANGIYTTMFISHDYSTDERFDAIVIENNNEPIASGWISNLLDTEGNEESESYFIKQGREKEIVYLLKQYSSGSEKAKTILSETKTYGMKLLIIIEIISSLMACLLIFVLLSFNLMQSPYANFFFVGILSIIFLPSIFAVLKRNKMVKERRKELLLKIIDDILLCRIYMVAANKLEKAGR